MRLLLALALTVILGTMGVAQPPALAPAPKAVKSTRVAVFVGEGARKTKGPVSEVIETFQGYEVELISAADIRDGKLKNFQILIQPGGSGSGQAKDLGADGRDRVKAFVKGGGGYVGICAGAYLASRSYDWSLHILDAEVIDRAHWARGTGDVELKLTAEGKQMFGVKKDAVTIYYGQGPLLAPGKDAAIPDYEPLAAYETEIHSKGGAQPGVMKGTTAAARGAFGSGRVFCFSPHPEKTNSDDTRAMLKAALVWTAGKK